MVLSKTDSSTLITLDGHSMIVCGAVRDGLLHMTIKPFAHGGAKEVMELGAPFREELDPRRISTVVDTLLSHDYLLRKKLHSGKELTFTISSEYYSRVFRHEAITSLEQESSLAAKPGEKVLPWILPTPGTSDLYPFQVEGVRWLLASNNRLLADDMGLGKTVQTIIAIRLGFSEQLFKSVLILCPKSLVLNWLAEFRKWAPELISLALAPSERSAEEVWGKALDNSHVAIANYEQVRGACLAMKQRQFDLVVADEAHRLRNASSQVSQSFRLLRRDRFWALTGTPIERDLRDLATLMSLLDEKRFSIADANTASSALREKAKPYILRRTKESVLKDLPDVMSSQELLSLHPLQLKTYRQVQSGYGCNGERITNALHKLGELRRVCDFDPVSRTSAKLERIHEELLDIKNLGEKALIFSYVREPLDALYTMTQSTLNSVLIDGRMSGTDRETALRRFKTDPNVTALYASSKVASEGLTIVEANHVFFINRWWNPSSNAQARDRVNRIGQKRIVFIHEYVCVGTIEEAIQKLLRSKNAIYDEVIGRIEADLLTNKDIAAHLENRTV
jgi:SNF2 family DNA or RNA helicase